MSETPPIATSPSSRAHLFTAVKWILFLAVIWFVGRSLARHIAAIDWSQVHPHIDLALLAACAIALVTVSQIAVYRLLLSTYGPALSWSRAATLSWIPALGKYIPGRVVALGSTVYLLRRYNIPAAVALSVTLMADALAVLTGLLVAAPIFRAPEVRAALPGGWIWAALLIAVALICLYPPVFARLINLALRRSKRAELKVVPDIRHYFLPVLASITQWIFWGIALWCTTRALATISFAQLPAFIAFAALANTIAYLAIFAPGGLGVRELILFIALDPLTGHGAAAVIVVALRLIQTLVELLLAILGVLLLRSIEHREIHSNGAGGFGAGGF